MTIPELRMNGIRWIILVPDCGKPEPFVWRGEFPQKFYRWTVEHGCEEYQLKGELAFVGIYTCDTHDWSWLHRGEDPAPHR